MTIEDASVWFNTGLSVNAASQPPDSDYRAVDGAVKRLYMVAVRGRFPLDGQVRARKMDKKAERVIGLSLIMWNGLYTAEKIVIQWTLLSEACYFAVQFLVTSVTLIELGILPNAAILLLLSRVLFLVVTMSFYYHLGRRAKKI